MQKKSIYQFHFEFKTGNKFNHFVRFYDRNVKIIKKNCIIKETKNKKTNEILTGDADCVFSNQVMDETG